MHTCMRCGRIIKTMLELQGGCTCGSKAFIFTKSRGEDIVLPSPCTTPEVNVPQKNWEAQKPENIVEKTIAPAQEKEQAAAQPVNSPETAVDGKTLAAENISEEKNGTAPSLPPVIDGFEAEGEFFIKPIETPKGNGFEIENVRLLESGVFEVDVLSLAKNPLVLKDQNDVYYVKLPLSKDISFLGNGKTFLGNGKIEKEEKKAENKTENGTPEN